MKPDNSEYRYWAFVSYSSKNKTWGRWVHRAIEAYGIPSQLVNNHTPSGQPAPKRFRPVFRDRDELPASADLSSHIDRALHSSRYLIVVCSRDAAQSQWVNKEIETFQSLGRDHRILAIIVDGEPNTGDERECFPPALRQLEPIAADVRPNGDGKINAKLKLLAGMLGVNLDVLKQRDARRRTRRMQMLLFLSFLITFIFASLSWYANKQRAAAVEQRKVAVNRMVDLRNLISALIQEMVDMLDDAAGPLTIKETLLVGSEGYLLKLKDEDPIDKGLVRELTLTYTKKGDTLFEQGKLSESLSSYKKGFEFSSQLSKQDESNASYQLDVASGYIGMARVLVHQGELTKAKMHFLNCIGLLEDLAVKLPEHNQVIEYLAKVNKGLFAIYFKQGEDEKARWYLEKSVQLYESLTEIQPRSAEIAVELADVYQRLAYFYRVSNHYDDAAHYAQKSVQLCDLVLEDMPRYKMGKQIRASGHVELSETYLKTDNLEESMYHAEKGEKDLRELLLTDPDWAMSTIRLAGALKIQAAILRRSSQQEESIEKLFEAKRWAENVLAIDASNVTARITGAMIHGNLVISLHHSGREDDVYSSLARFEELYLLIHDANARIDNDLMILKDKIEKLKITP